MSEHTPGPWRDWNKSCGAVMAPKKKDTWGSRAVALVTHWPSEEERAANARLIAAAPDLLDALEKLVGSCPPLGPWDEEDWGSPSNDAMAVAAAAIAKAKGEGA